MTRGAKIVVFSIVGLFLLAGMYFTFFAPPVPTETLADTTPTVSESSTLTLAPSLPDGAPSLQDGALGPPDVAPMGMSGFPASNDPAFATSTMSAPMVPVIPTDPTGFNQPLVAPAAPTLTMDTTTPAAMPAPVIVAPEPKVASKPAVSNNYTSYTVVSGDTLSSIAGVWFRDTSKWKSIADINPGLKPTTLKVGQKINLPAKSVASKSGKSALKTASASAGSAGAATPTAANEHVVSSGETLASISDKAYGNRSNWKRIYEANKGVIGSDPSRLKVGMKLTIPAKS